ncbi:amidase family protein [Rhodothermus profundi]|uniref:Amidase n=1 Tax=Rhodothermus profundi TaxID=633813 RepID=A0A1M6X9E9_9BACT|nr:amidase family protein [Rhodothermus profundi]SHL02548.1 amidase [Rhodothermus profundi]
MKRLLFGGLLLVSLASCRSENRPVFTWTPYDEAEELAENAAHPSRRMRFKLIQSQLLDKNALLQTISRQLEGFTEEDYRRLYPLIYEQDILTLQEHVQAGRLSYELITKWYLYRIARYESDRERYLNAVVAINPNAVAEAREKDRQRPERPHPLYGMPVLVKDNINTAGMPTTAGAHLLRENWTDDAFIIRQIRAHGGIILGKTNLSEWANFLFFGGPNGFSAVGGQTLNPYGRRRFDSGGSSSGSGAAIAANYAVVSVGTETSGSILSPSSQHSLVGLKPTVGLLSRAGIVPISSTYDTPGPMARTVRDAAILLSAMIGRDPDDPATAQSPESAAYWEALAEVQDLKGYRLGAFQAFLENPYYQEALDVLRSLGAEVVVFEPPKVDLDGFGEVLAADMKTDLPRYLARYAAAPYRSLTVAEIVAYNRADSARRIPYGQGRFAQMLTVSLSPEELAARKQRLHDEAVRFFEEPMQQHRLDAVLSINNWHARPAALAHYPALTVPIGLQESGEPIGLTFIARSFEEALLLRMGYAFEQAMQGRVPPSAYALDAEGQERNRAPAS